MKLSKLIALLQAELRNGDKEVVVWDFDEKVWQAKRRLVQVPVEEVARRGNKLIIQSKD